MFSRRPGNQRGSKPGDNVLLHGSLPSHRPLHVIERYVDGAGTENREAAALNPLYGLIQPRDCPGPTERAS